MLDWAAFLQAFISQEIPTYNQDRVVHSGVHVSLSVLSVREVKYKPNTNS